jgi:hypothetical protein
MKQFRVIQGGKTKGSRVSKPRLFRAYSISDLQRDQTVYHDVRFNWYCLERDEPPFPFADMIADYGNLDDKQKSFMERSVNRYFTELEVEELQKHLHEEYGMQLLVDDMLLPLKDRGAFFEEGSSVIYDFLELSEKEGYPLPFKVWGYYTLNFSISSPSLDAGVRFLSKAIDLLGLRLDVKRADLESVVKRLYSDEGLVVTGPVKKPDGET